jgi:MFS family permease
VSDTRADSDPASRRAPEQGGPKRSRGRLIAGLRSTVAVGGRDAQLLLVARVLMSAQRALVGVFAPIYLARRGLSATEIGVLFSAVALCGAAISAAVGFGADRIGRKPFVVYIPLLSAGAAFVFAFVGSKEALFIAAAIGSFGRGSGAGAGMVGPYQPAEQALLAGLVDDRSRPRLFANIASASAMGGLLGAILAATPLTQGAAGPAGAATYRYAFLVAALLALLPALLALPVRERPRSQGASQPARKRAAGGGRLSAPARTLVLRLAATNTVNGVAVGLFGPFVSYWLYRRFGASPGAIGLLYIAANIVTLITNQFSTLLARRHGMVRTVVIARALQALLLIPLALSPNLYVAGAIYSLRLIAQRIGLALRQTFVMTAAPANERAKVAALSQLPVQGASASAPTLAGYLFDTVGLAVPFEIAGALQLVNAGLFQWFFGRSGEAGDRRPPGLGDGAGEPQRGVLPGAILTGEEDTGELTLPRSDP